MGGDDAGKLLPSRVYKAYTHAANGNNKLTYTILVILAVIGAIDVVLRSVWLLTTAQQDSTAAAAAELPNAGVWPVPSVATGSVLETSADSSSSFVPLASYDGAFTVYLNTFDRDVLLGRAVAHYAQSAMVSRILISWNNIGTTTTHHPHIGHTHMAAAASHTEHHHRHHHLCRPPSRPSQTELPLRQAALASAHPSRLCRRRWTA